MRDPGRLLVAVSGRDALVEPTATVCKSSYELISITATPTEPGGTKLWCTLDGVEDLAALLDSHACQAGQCAKNSHIQPVLVSAADVATAPDEIRLLVSVRDTLSAAGLRMLEMEPTPRFENDSDGESKSWPLKYEAIPVAGVAPPANRRWLGFLRESG